MKKSNNFLLLIVLALLLPNITIGQNVFESFEQNCSTRSNVFFAGCIDDWISVSGTPDNQSSHNGVTSPGTVTAFHGGRYVRMYTKHVNNCDEAIRGESIAINYDFQAGQEYTVSYACRWDEYSPATAHIETKSILTNGRGNQMGSFTGCDPGEELPEIEPGDQTLMIHTMDGAQTSWETFSRTFTPSVSFSQLWIRPEMVVSSDMPNSTGYAELYFDAFEIETCTNVSLNSNFDLAFYSDFDGNVTVETWAEDNPVFVNHWWDIYYADPNTGAPTGNNQVPGNWYQCCDSQGAEFSNNLEVNVWYYVKHGVWNNCTRWQETREVFRAQRRRSNSGRIIYDIEFKDIKFEPSEEYLAEMNEMVANLAPKELREHNQKELNFEIEPTSSVNAISNYPNPFNGTTTIEFNLEKEQNVSLKVYDLTGRTIAVLLENDLRTKGRNQVLFDGNNLSEGIYFYTIESNGYTETKRMVLRK